MAKKILVDNSGSYQEISELFINNLNILSTNLLTINTASYGGYSGLLQSFNGQLIPVNTSSTNNPQNNYSGSVLAYSDLDGFGPHRTEAASFSGDLSGDLTTSVKVRSLSNVTGGVLSTLYGGLGTGSIDVGSVLFSSGSKPSYTGQNNKLLAVTGENGEVNLIDSSSLSLDTISSTVIYLYTGSISTSAGATTTSFTWIKPGTINSLFPNIKKPRFIRVICQGAGSSGTNYYIADSARQGPGGGGGGYSDVTFNANYIADSVTCLVGNGGARTTGFFNGVLASPSYGNLSNSGGNTSFGSYIVAYGGSGNTGGIGFISNGGNGGAFNTTGTSVVIGGAGGGGGGGTGAVAGKLGGAITKYNLQPRAGGSAGNNTTGGTATNPIPENFLHFSQIAVNNILNQSIPNLVCAGGSGGGGTNSSTNNVGKGGGGSSPTFGSGGGGGGYAPTENRASGRGGGSGGSGGSGYMIIICY